MPDVRTYRAATMQDALARVRAELGADAVILATRSVPVRKLVPWGEKEEIEITAGTGISTRAAAALPVRSRVAAAYGLSAQEQRAAEIVKELQRRNVDGPLRTVAERQPKAAAATATPSATAELSGRLDAIERLLADLGRRPWPTPATHLASELPEHLRGLCERLIAAEVDAPLARELADALPQHGPSDPAATRLRMLHAVEAELPCCGPILITPGVRKVVALIGPTGVGKTTTIAKLAANFRLRDQLRTGLITVDTYRIAAVDQLRTYAEIIDLPMQVVTTPAEMTTALAELGDLDIVLIDTAGRSPRDAVQIQELSDLLAAASPDEVHLVLSITAGRRAIAQAAARFASAQPTAVIATKLDEADGAGPVLSLCRDTRLPLSYITTGQDVPDDIEPARADRLAREIVSGARVNA